MFELRGIFCILRLITIVLSAALSLAAAETAMAQDYKSSGTAPPSWVQFAKLVKYRFEEWTGSSDPRAARFRIYVKVHMGRPDGPPPVLDVKAWINPDGSVARVSFPEFGDRGANEDLRAILKSGNIGERPPPDMLQPVNLRFSISAFKMGSLEPRATLH